MTVVSALAVSQGTISPGPRLLTAVALSLLAHLFLLSLGEVMPPGQTLLRVTQPLEVFIPGSVTLPSVEEKAIADEFREQEKIPDAPAGRAVSIPATTESRDPIARNDDRFFGARELDRYPLPLAPLALNNVPSVSGVVRFWVNIDQFGKILEATLVNQDMSASMSANIQDMARRQLLATQFMPAVKNNRPVRSRILLELHMGR